MTFKKKANVARDNYLAKTSTAKLVAQNFIIGNVGSHLYRNARARNESRASAYIEALIGGAISPIVGLGIEQYKKEKYYGDK